jgi:hypothetical protein
LFGAAGEADEGLVADALTLPPGVGHHAPDPRTGGGQVLLVLQGSLVLNGAELGVRSAIAVTPDERAVSFAAGSDGAQALILQYPKREQSGR